MVLLDRHLEALPRRFAALLLSRAQHDVRVVDLAQRLPDTDETHHWREVCLYQPEVLRALRERMATTSREEVARAENATAQ